MGRTRTRMLFAATAAAAVLTYGLLGHGLLQLSAHDGMAGAAAGLCLLLATVVVLVQVAKPVPQRIAVAREPLVRSLAPAASSAPSRRARASPAVLQRFLN